MADPITVEVPMFHCDSYGINIPEDKQGFCAIQVNKGRIICIDCERGKAAAKAETDKVRSGLPSGDRKNAKRNSGK